MNIITREKAFKSVPFSFSYLSRRYSNVTFDDVPEN